MQNCGKLRGYVHKGHQYRTKNIVIWLNRVLSLRESCVLYGTHVPRGGVHRTLGYDILGM